MDFTARPVILSEEIEGGGPLNNDRASRHAFRGVALSAAMRPTADVAIVGPEDRAPFDWLVCCSRIESEANPPRLNS